MIDGLDSRDGSLCHADASRGNSLSHDGLRAALEASRRAHMRLVQQAIAAGYPADELRHDEAGSAAAVGQLIVVCSAVDVRAPMVLGVIG